MAESEAGLGIGQVVQQTGLSEHTSRFYEREGILPHPIRCGPDGRRRYSEEDVEWLGVCVVLRASGMPMRAIRRYTDLVRQGSGNEKERLMLPREHRERVIDQMGQLTRCLDLITYKVGVYEDIVACDAGTGATRTATESPTAQEGLAARWAGAHSRSASPAASRPR